MASLIAPEATTTLDWAVAAQPFRTERESGDLHVVVDTAEGILIGVIDGLGHGPKAATAARLAGAAIEENASSSLEEILRHCNGATMGSRGAAITLARVEPRAQTLTWAGVGNVLGVLRRSVAGEATEWAPLQAGIVGSRFPRVRVKTVPMQPEDRLILATDGIQPDFIGAIVPRRQLQHIADQALAEHGLDDDRLVLVARYTGGYE